MKYVAIRAIPGAGDTAAFAYQPGDLVHESLVDGADAMLKLGEDVSARPGLEISRPALNASQAAWAEYAISAGTDRDEAEGMSRADLIALFDEPSDDGS